MRIEKINDTQIRVTLSHSDLNPRNIKINELAYGSKKAQELFREMMTQAYEEFGFETEDLPIMIEAVPLSNESIMLVVTKIDEPGWIDSRFDAEGMHPTHQDYQFYDERSGRLANAIHPTQSQEDKEPSKNIVLTYSFSSLQQIVDVGHRINAIYCGMNSAYKQDDQTYFLTLHPNLMQNISRTQLESVLDEFGTRRSTSPLGENFLMEHATLLVKDKALEVLTTYL